MKSKLQLERLRIASPCPTTWEQMKGDERARFCELCNLHVYNIAELSAAEARSLVTTTEGRLCARLYRRSDGTVITKDCPVGLRAIRRRVARVAGAAFATILSLCGGAFGQKAKDDKSCRQQVKITRTLESQLESGAIAGTVLDPIGAVIPNAKVTLIDEKSGNPHEQKTDDNGRFKFSGVASGSYRLEIKVANFKDLIVKDVKVGAKETANVEATLLFDGTTMTVGIVALSELEFESGVLRMSGETLRKLPIP